MVVVPIFAAAKASLVEREVSAEQADGGIDTGKYPVFALAFGEIVAQHRTIPQSKIKDFCQLPLHKGAFVPFSNCIKNACTAPAKGLYRHLLCCVTILRSGSFC